MGHIEEGTLLWEPDETWKENANIYHYMNWLKTHKHKYFNDYQSLWEWSVEDLEGCWESLWEYFDIQANEPYQTVLTSHKMPGARWFPEATINYTEHIFKGRDWNETAIIHASEGRKKTEVTWSELYHHTASLQRTLSSLVVGKGERVVAYVANIYEAVVAFLATASIGAIWSSASPDFGTQSVIDRFRQIETKVMFT